MCRPYSVLLPVGFTLPFPLPGPRCALTAPFHPYRIFRRGGLLSVALSLGSPPPAINRHRRSVEPGLSSRAVKHPRPPDPLTTASLVVALRFGKQQCEQDHSAFGVDLAIDQFLAETTLERDDRRHRVGHVIAEPF